MPRTYGKTRKTKSPAQQAALQKGRAVVQLLRDANKENIHPQKTSEQSVPPQSTNSTPDLKERLATTQKKLWNTSRKVRRAQTSLNEARNDLADVKAANFSLLEELRKVTKAMGELEKDAELVLAAQQERLEGEILKRKECVRVNTALKLRNRKLLEARKREAARVLKLRSRRGFVYRMRRRGIYTADARAMARRLVDSGTSEQEVGAVIQDVGRILGVEIKDRMSERTVGRAILERGVAADIQSGYEMAASEKLTFSSDSTSHMRIEYECRSIALRVADYKNPNAEPVWTMRSLGVSTSVNHTSETQVSGLKERLKTIEETFEKSPFAKRHKMSFRSDDFAYKLAGTSGDHAADQKKSHEILREWKMNTVYERLGEETLIALEPLQAAALLLSLKVKQVSELGGAEEWEKLTEDEKQTANIRIIREVGMQAFQNLPDSEKKELSHFFRTGCCMHKDLNTFKGGDKALCACWDASGKTPPILLANKDNAMVLALAVDPENPTPAEKRAADVSKRGGCHAALLGGLICRNKDKKKGQQNAFTWYMETHVGIHVAYPDVSNTRYGTYGEAAATIVVYRGYFRAFMEYVRDKKDTPRFTNIEQNFYNALNDTPTFVELCVLAVYTVCVSRPFMRYVRRHQNILTLRDLFEKKVKLLDAVAADPTIWTASDSGYDAASLCAEPWDEWEVTVMEKIRSYAPTLSDLNHAVTAFSSGARSTFSERFMDEFREGGEIDQLTEAQRSALFFPSTNDRNEGGLGSWRVDQRARPSKTIHKFNAVFLALQNDTEQFMATMLNTEDDQAYLRAAARKQDGSKLQRKVVEAQITADMAKVALNREKAAERVRQKHQKEIAINETAQHLVLDDKGIEKLLLKEVDNQLDFHRREEGIFMSQGGNLNERVPLKSHMKNKAQKVVELKKAVARYLQRLEEQPSNPTRPVSDQDGNKNDEEDEFYLSDYNDDLK